MAIELVNFQEGEPEDSQRQLHTKETDMWAFGMVIYVSDDLFILSLLMVP